MQGKFLGKTVQVVPHITDEIKNNIYKLSETGKYDIVIRKLLQARGLFVSVTIQKFDPYINVDPVH